MTFEPTTFEEVQACLQLKAPIRIRSSALSAEESGTLSLAKFDQVLLYEPEEMIVKVQAGVTLERLTTLLAEKRQWIPTLVHGEHPQATVGAAIASDPYHPRATILGSLRTTILGGTFVSADGTLFKSGSRVVKSVAGYDIHRAFCGSQGKFGAILTVTLKVQPMPEQFFWFFTQKDNLEGIRPYYPTISEVHGDGIFCELAGFEEDIRHDIADLTLRGFMTQDYGDLEARRIVRELMNKKRAGAPSGAQFETLRRAFDPEGILQ